MLAQIAYAGDCPNPQQDPYTPADVENQLSQQQTRICCCFDNDISAETPVFDIWEENMCCNVEDTNCNTYLIGIRRTAEAVVRDGPMNELDEYGDPVYEAVPAWTLDYVCLCGGGGMAGFLCQRLESTGTVYDFSCVYCPYE